MILTNSFQASYLTHLSFYPIAICLWFYQPLQKLIQDNSLDFLSMSNKRDYLLKSTIEGVRNRNAHIWLARFPQDFSTASFSHLDQEQIYWHSLLYIHIVQAFIICVNILKAQAWIEIVYRLNLAMWLKCIVLEFTSFPKKILFDIHKYLKQIHILYKNGFDIIWSYYRFSKMERVRMTSPKLHLRQVVACLILADGAWSFLFQEQ